MEEVILEAEKRDITTKGALKDFRKNGFIPSVIYGRKKKSITLTVSRKSFIAALHTEMGDHVLIHLKIKGEKDKNTVIIRDMYIDAISREVKHIDFQRVSMTEKIEVSIPFELKNAAKSIGVKRGGIAELLIHEVKLKCLPAQMPKSILVDIGSKDIGDNILVKDLEIASALELQISEESIVANIVAPRLKEEPKEEEEVKEGSEPEVITKKKEEEESKKK